MAILEKEVWIGLGGSNKKHFESLGYTIPKGKDKWGKIRVPRGTKILVKVNDMPKRSKVKLTKICDICGGIIYNQPYEAILQQRKEGNGKDRCLKCASIQTGINKKDNVKYENSFEYWAKTNNKEYLLNEFSDKNEKRPYEISYGNSDYYLWNCHKCKGQYTAKLSNRVSLDRNCPYCAGRKVLIGFNDLWTTYPEVAKLLLNPERGYEISYGSNRKEFFKCNECGNIESKCTFQVVTLGYSCVACSDSISYPEKMMFSILKQLGVNFEPQKTFKWSKNVICGNKKLNGSKRYDFYVEEFDCIIETHGEQHYEKGFNKSRLLEEEQENDELKEKLAISNGIKNYIVIDARYSSLEWIKNKIIESKLSDMFDLSEINWIEAHEFSCSSLVKEVCDLWSNGIKSTLKISDLTKLHFSTVTKYLKQGVELGWCDYDPKEAMKRTGKLNGKKNKKQIVQLTIDGEFIKEWDSATDACNVLNTNGASISNVLTGKNLTAGGFKWMYKKDFNELKHNKLNNCQ
ncbi:hypothetical protein COE51_01310 [Bacillus pseudomycoides]|nr:hypothetical protein COE51_01310 [Bacillus pseudomycoides]